MADEPTGNLDGATGVEVADLMFRLNREHGTTLVLVTHDVALAARCGRRLSLAAGRLVGDERTALSAASTEHAAPRAAPAAPRLARRRVARAGRGARARGRQRGHRRLLRRSREGRADAAGEPAARRRPHDLRRSPAAARVRRQRARARTRDDAGHPLQQHGAAQCAAGRRRGRRADRREGRRRRLSVARRDHAGGRGPARRRADAAHSRTRRSMARLRGSPIAWASRSAIRSRWAKRRSRSARSCRRSRKCGRGVRAGSQAPAQHRRRSRDQPAAARQSRDVAAAGRRPRGTRRARHVSRLAVDANEGGPAAGNRARPASRSAADARSRGKIPRARRAGRGAARRGRRRARRVALPAPASRCGGDVPLLRREGRADARALLRAVPRAGRSRLRRRRGAGAGGPASAGDAAGVRRRDRLAAPDVDCRALPRSRRECCCCSASRCRRWSRSRTCRRCACCAATCRVRAPAACSPTCSARRRSRC